MFTRSIGLAAAFSVAVSASFDAQSSSNVAIYWGQGDAQITLPEVCSDESIDIVNLAFLNEFPTAVGEYPGNNFANACEPEWYTLNGVKTKLSSNCPLIGPGIKKCHENGKKVFLSLGGGVPTNYSLPSQEVAEYFADFVWGAFGPLDPTWEAAGKPRPFGDVAVDGFDLDLEAWIPSAASNEYQYVNYDHFVNKLRSHYADSGGEYYISGAPQCIVPDERMAYAIERSHFDFLFVQFYNTAQCNTRRGYEGLGKDTTTFTFDAWVAWLNDHSANQNVKIYLGMPASDVAVPSDPTSYLTPTEAEKLINAYKSSHPERFGGVMLWEVMRNIRNPICDRPYSTYIRSILDGTFQNEVCPSTSVSLPSSTSSSVPSPTAVSPDGSCGPKSGYTCAGSAFGNCCSAYGYCGSTSIYCDVVEGCQSLFGACGSASLSSSSNSAPSLTSSPVPTATAPSAISTDGSCGGTKGYTCVGSTFGDCCSSYGWCGSSSLHCDAGCQNVFGICPNSVSNPVSIKLNTLDSNTVPTALSSSPPFPTNGNSTVVAGPTGTQPSVSLGTGSSFSDSPALSANATTSSGAIRSSAGSMSPTSAPFPGKGNSTSVFGPTGTISGIVTTASSSAPVAPFPTSNNSSFIPSGTGISTILIGTVTSSGVIPLSTAGLGNFTSRFSSTGSPIVDSGTALVQASTTGTGSNQPMYTAISGAVGPSGSLLFPSHSAHGPYVNTTVSAAGYGHANPTSYGVAQPSSAPVYGAQQSSSRSFGSSHSLSSSVTSQPTQATSPVSTASSPATTVYTTTYVDICPTGWTTITTTFTRTICDSCAKPTSPPAIPADWTETVTVCTACGPIPTTVTLTKPANAPFAPPSLPTYKMALINTTKRITVSTASTFGPKSTPSAGVQYSSEKYANQPGSGSPNAPVDSGHNSKESSKIGSSATKPAVSSPTSSSGVQFIHPSGAHSSKVASEIHLSVSSGSSQMPGPSSHAAFNTTSTASAYHAIATGTLAPQVAQQHGDYQAASPSVPTSELFQGAAPELVRFSGIGGLAILVAGVIVW
ncbi:unnamed protein product [Periconia digitata]|uniref:Chitinase n=1 Tax=Periconia digitata TaxID=1303443 RepID=A0A9W4UGH6_9PLEO|nr:unnamed protein product [Periconia digitata]